MKVVLDTNVLLISLPLHSPYRPIFDGLRNGDFTLVVSNEILTEYEEILSKQINPEIAQNVIKFILALPNLIEQQIYFKWGLISIDPDDNKFVDCAIASGAKFIVTEDRHFNSIKREDFFSLEIINSDAFLEALRDGKD